MTLPAKEAHELRDAFQFLLIWQDHLQSIHGALEALSHLSNPDDPPDVIAHFENRDVAIEITTLNPAHIRQSDALHKKVGNGRGRSEIPLSMKPANRQEALEMMYNPSKSLGEAVADRNQVWCESILERVTRKLENPMLHKACPGIILLPGDMYGEIGEAHAIEQAFTSIRTTTAKAEGWTLAVCHQWNHLHYFSAIDSPESGIKISQRH